MNEKNFQEEIEVPEGVTATVENSRVTLKGSNGEVSRAFVDPKIGLEGKDGKIIIKCGNVTKREKTKIGTIKAHLRNMFKGVTEGHTYRLKICSGHFPMNVSVKGNQFIVNNFLGEKVPRTMGIREGVNIKIDGSEVEVTSSRKELAGQAAADIELLCKITRRDKRIFQDGIYITSKDGKEI